MDDDDFDLDVSIDDDTPIPDYVPNYEPEDIIVDDIPFTVVEEMPKFPGGTAEMYIFLRENVIYPRIASELGIQGKVYLAFVVEKDGSISNIEVMREVGGGCTEEALRVLKSMPKWTPGKQRGKAVRVKFHIPVKFTLKYQ